jgi:hypothetical protein
VTFEVDKIAGPFELCHCSRCRKSTGSAFAATVAVMASGFRITFNKQQLAEFRVQYPLEVAEEVPK